MNSTATLTGSHLRTYQTILPHAPGDVSRPAEDAKDFSRSGEKPDPNRYFEPIAKAFGAVGPILIFGSGTGKSSEMDQCHAWLKVHHPKVARRVVGLQVVDEHHLTEGELLAKAREFYREPQKTGA